MPAVNRARRAGVHVAVRLEVVVLETEAVVVGDVPVDLGRGLAAVLAQAVALVGAGVVAVLGLQEVAENVQVGGPHCEVVFVAA